MTAFVMVCWFAFTKQSFSNHWLSALGALCVAAAATNRPVEVEHERVDVRSSSGAT